MRRIKISFNSVNSFLNCNRARLFAHARKKIKTPIKSTKKQITQDVCVQNINAYTLSAKRVHNNNNFDDNDNDRYKKFGKNTYNISRFPERVEKNLRYSFKCRCTNVIDATCDLLLVAWSKLRSPSLFRVTDSREM